MVDHIDATAGVAHAAVFGEPGRLARRRAEELETEAHEKQAAARRCMQSASGEEATARELAGLPVGFTVFHDLRRSRGQGNIDHLVIGPTGAFVVESTTATGPDVLRRHVDGLVAQATDIGADLDGVDAKPVLCLVAASQPGPTVELGPVVAVPRSGLVDLIVGGRGVLSEREVRSNVHLVHQRFLGFWVGSDVEPDVAPGPGPSVTRPASPAADAAPDPGHPNRARRIALRSALGLLVLVFAVVGVRCGVDTVRGLSPRPTASPKLRPVAVCPSAGAGYSIQLAFPGTSHPDIAAFDVRALVGGQLWVDLGTWRSSSDVANDLTGIGSSTLVEVRASTVFVDGSSLPERTVGLRTPPEPC